MQTAADNVDPDDDASSTDSAVAALDPQSGQDRQSPKPSRWDQFLERPIWHRFWMPLVTNGLLILFIGLLLRSTEFQDKIRSAGILAHVDIIKNDYLHIRSLAMKLRRLSHGINTDLVARAGGETPQSIQDEALKVLAELDDALYVIRTLDDRYGAAGASEFAEVIRQAQTMVQQLHQCLSPVVVTDAVRIVCAGVVKKYRQSIPGEVGPALALQLVDNTMRVIRYQFAPPP
jgi:hypothetical protein